MFGGSSDCGRPLFFMPKIGEYANAENRTPVRELQKTSRPY